MRPDRARVILEDIRDASSFILQATAGKKQEDYDLDRLLRNAVERNFEIIGEAMRRLARESPEAIRQINEYERIIAFRNILIHGYDLIDDELVWDTIERKVPVLLREVENLLKDEVP